MSGIEKGLTETTLTKVLSLEILKEKSITINYAFDAV